MSDHPLQAVPVWMLSLRVFCGRRCGNYRACGLVFNHEETIGQHIPNQVGERRGFIECSSESLRVRLPVLKLDLAQHVPGSWLWHLWHGVAAPDHLQLRSESTSAASARCLAPRLASRTRVTQIGATPSRSIRALSSRKVSGSGFEAGRRGNAWVNTPRWRKISLATQ